MFRWVNVRVFLLYFTIIFLATFALLERSTVYAKPKIKEFSFDKRICNNVLYVKSYDEEITIKYINNSHTNVKNITRYFALKTKWLGSDIYFPPESANIKEITSDTLTLQFFMPIVDNYSATLYCINPNFTKIPRKFDQLSPYLKRKYSVNLEAKEFTEDADYSRLIVHNKERWSIRWCEGRNIPFFDGTFFFLSPAIFEFPQPFLVPGPRAPPFDKDIDRFTFEPVVIQYTKYNAPKDFVQETRFVYYYGVFHNYYMLWHTYFDFIVPLFRFMNEMHPNEKQSERIVYVKSDGVWMFHKLMKALSTTDIMLTSSISQPTIFERMFLGIRKYERNINENQSEEGQVTFQYSHFDRNSVPGLRNAILEQNQISTTKVGDGGKPYVIFIDRKTGRNIDNADEVFELLKEKCDFCTVERLRAEEVPVETQIDKFSRCSVLVGLHGSGLANVMLMAASRPNHTTHMVEFLPYMYHCRPWYKTAAEVARVKYHEVMNKLPNLELKGMGYCWGDYSRCATLACHDKLRDQKFAVDLDILNETFAPIVEELKSTVVSDV